MRIYPVQHHPVKWEVHCAECDRHPTKWFAYRHNAIEYARAICDPLWSRLLESEIEYAHPRDLPHVAHGNCPGRARLDKDEHVYGDPSPNS